MSRNPFLRGMLYAVLTLLFGLQVSFAQFGTQSGIRLPFIGHYSVSTGPGCSATHGPAYPGSMEAIDFANGFVVGTPVYAAYPGTVSEAAMNGNFGGTVTINDSSNFVTRYGHLSKLYVSVGQHVAKGALIALSGDSGGVSTGAHLHFEVRDENGAAFPIADWLTWFGNGLVWDDTSAPIDYCYDSPSDSNSYSGEAYGAQLSSNPYGGCREFSALGFDEVALFDHKNCQGNFIFLPNSGVYYRLFNSFDDRTRSVYIPPGKSVFVAADATNPSSAWRCLDQDKWNLDVDSYQTSGNTIRIGWQSKDVANMISAAMVLDNSTCTQNNGHTIIAAPAGTYPSVTYEIGMGNSSGTSNPNVTPTPLVGNSRVDLYENTNYQPAQYGWDILTAGWVNVPNYMDNAVSSITLDGGWSIRVAKDQNGGGATKCLVTSYSDLSGAYYDNGDPMTDTISSVWVFQDSTCGGAYLGTEPGDTVTVWVNPSYNGTHYGWHDPFNGNTENYVANAITAIGVTPGWSAVVYESQNLGGGFTCFTASDPDLTDNYMNTGVPVNDTVESIEIFHDTNCGGRIHAPTAMLTSTVTNVAAKEATNHLVWSGASPGWQHFDFGDGTSYDVQGASGDVSPTHQYANYGTYDITVTVYGTDGVGYFYSQTLEVEVPEPVLSLSFTRSTYNFNHIEVQAEWSNAAEDWQVVDFGDGGSVGYFGSSGTSVGHAHGNSHDYAVGTYTLTFNVKGLDGQTYTVTQTVDIQVPPAPSVSLVATVTDPIHGLVETNAIWRGASEAWHTLTWGDGTESGYFGQSGTNVGNPNGYTHYYQPGTYTLTFTVRGLDGQNYTATQQVTISPPTYSLSATVVEPATGLVETNAIWSNAENGWQILNWGDGTETGYLGSAGTNVGHAHGYTHYYSPGTYTITFTVLGGNGQTYVTTQSVTISPPTATPVPPTATPIPQPSYSLTINSVDQNSGLVVFTLNWSNALADWHHIDFGNGQAFDVNGSSGSQQASHTYNPGNYTMTFTVKGMDGQQYPTSQQISVSGPPTATPVPQPSVSLDIVSIDNQTGTVQFRAQWSNAQNDWQRVDFGHDGQYVDYQGGSGDTTDLHVYNPGSYTMTFTVKGLDGNNYTSTEQFSIGG
jgi:hypothetical protein